MNPKSKTQNILGCIASVLSALAILTSTARSASLIVWDEFVNGDLPVSLGPLEAGINTVRGAVGRGGGFGSGDGIDLDWVQFEVPAGTRLEQFILTSVSSERMALALDRGNTVSGDTVEFGLFGPRVPPIDLLQFDSAPGPQPPGVYIFSIRAIPGRIFMTYTLDIMVSPLPCSFVVTRVSDSGPGSLRAAIDCANANPGLDTISFNIPGAGSHTIRPLSPLPEIRDAVVIDGTTQPGFVGRPIIELDGSGAGSPAIGLTIVAPNCAVRGLVINRFSGRGGNGINLEFADHCQVEGNFIGTDLTGTIALENDIGVVLFGSHNCTIGGTTPAARNLISGNAFSGVSFLLNSDSNVVQGNSIGTEISGTHVLVNLPGFPGAGEFYPAGIVLQDSHSNIIGGTTVEARNVISGNHVGIVILNGPIDIPSDGNVIQGNFIGTDKDGIGAVPNETGVRLAYESGINTIGGTIAGARNIISGNEQAGISLDIDGGPGPLVQGNYIGTDVTGTRKLANGNGITIPGMNATVGGATPEERNLISGNAADGIQMLGTRTSSGNRVSGNFIGTDKDGLAALGNGGHGVLLSGNAAYNLIGGLTHTAGNTIAFNGGDGVSVTVSGIPAHFPDYNAILGNSIFSNAGLGINLGSDGVTPNDVGDGDNGPNFLQNFPILISVISGGGSTTIRGSLNSSPSTAFRIEFFANDACDLSGFGEGQRLIGVWTVTTGPSGKESFRIIFSGTLDAGQFVTATATDQYDNTSEFSPCIPVGNRR